jgi:hypothetical protein
MSIIIMAASSVERVLLICILNVVMSAVEVVMSPDTFLFFFVRFVITDYFAVSDFSVFRDVSEFDKEKRVGARDVPNALE